MPLYTCPRCRYTFPSTDRPTVCPDCGHRSPALASEVDFDRFYSARLSTLREELAPEMTPDERNWIRVLLCLNHPRASYYTVAFLRDHVLEATPEMALDTYKSLRWEFIRKVNESRDDLKREGIVEPNYLLRDSSGHPRVIGWEVFGLPLKTLYTFEVEDPHAVPGLEALQAIDLEKVTTDPSGAYTRFLRAWLDLASSPRRGDRE